MFHKNKNNYINEKYFIISVFQSYNNYYSQFPNNFKYIKFVFFVHMKMY